MDGLAARSGHQMRIGKWVAWWASQSPRLGTRGSRALRACGCGTSPKSLSLGMAGGSILARIEDKMLCLVFGSSAAPSIPASCYIRPTFLVLELPKTDPAVLRFFGHHPLSHVSQSFHEISSSRKNECDSYFGKKQQHT